MGTQVAFVLGLLTGVVVYWFIYRIYWQRWRGYLQRDQAYLQEKIKSAEFTSLGLERQLAGQKGDLAALRSKINDLERDNRQALVKEEEARKEKDALVSHLDTLRMELAGFKKAAAGPALPGFPEAQPSNGNSHEPVQPPNGKASELALPSNGKLHEPVDPTLLPELILIPVNGNGKGNGAAEKKVDAPKKASTNGRPKPYFTPELLNDPVLVIARPRMDGDRLEIIQGIGLTIVKKLRLEGIDSFLALSRLSPEEFKKIVGARAAKMIDAEKVIEQAKKLARDRK